MIKSNTKNSHNFFIPFLLFPLSLSLPYFYIESKSGHDEYMLHFYPKIARDCLYLGKHSFNNGYYGQAIEWFEEALHRANLEGNTTAPVDEITPFYTMALTIVSVFFSLFFFFLSLPHCRLFC